MSVLAAPETFGNRYDPAETPPSGFPLVSRWFLAVGQGGAATDPRQTVVACRSALISRWQEPEATTEHFESDLFKVVAPPQKERVTLADPLGEWKLVKAYTVTLPISHGSRRPTKFGRVPPDPAGEGSLVDRLILQEPGAWKSVRDAEAYEAWRLEAQANEIRGRPLSEGTRQLAIALLHRAGASISAAERAVEGL